MIASFHTRARAHARTYANSPFASPSSIRCHIIKLADSVISVS